MGRCIARCLGAMRSALGDFKRVRDVVLMPADAWSAGVAAMKVVVSPATDTVAEVTRPLNALEQCQVGSFRRVCRMLVGQPPAEGPAAADVQGQDARAASPARRSLGEQLTSSISGRKTRLASTIDQGDDGEVDAMNAGEFREFARKPNLRMITWSPSPTRRQRQAKCKA